MSTDAVQVSVVIPTCDRPTSLQRTVASVLASLDQLGGPAEVVVVDNGRQPVAADTAGPWADGRVRLVRNEPPGVSRARNRGVAETSGQVVLFVDDDVVVTAGWAAALAGPILAGDADAVAGAVRLADHLRRPWMTTGHRLAFAETVAEGLPFPSMVTASLGLARPWALRVPFDEQLGPGALGMFEDLFLWHQLYFAGARLVAGSVEGVAIHHPDPARLSRAGLLEHARKGGLSEAYAAHHYFHARHRLARLRLVKHQLRWLWSQRPAAARPRDHATDAEMRLIREVAYFQQYLRERRRPRRYPHLGLLTDRRDAGAPGLRPVPPEPGTGG